MSFLLTWVLPLLPFLLLGFLLNRRMKTMSGGDGMMFGLGGSGASPHTVGMQSSAHIVAVCDDPDAPIFEIADFGVVGDVTEVVPAALAAIEEARSQA